MPDNAEKEETGLTEEELGRAVRVIPPEKLSRFLSAMGKLKELLDDQQGPFGRAFVDRLNNEMLRLENVILNGKEDSLVVKRARVEYDVRKADADWILSKHREYAHGVTQLKKAGKEKG